jgi:transcriptional regulator with XRE-family HTH domain
MVRISELRTADEVRARDMQDLEYRREYERTRLANDIAIKVLQYRQANNLSQKELAARLGMRQPNIARLESGDHAPSLDTLSRLADALKLDFSVEVKPGQMRLRNPFRQASRSAGATVSTLASRVKKARVPATPQRSRIAAAPALSNPKRAGDRKPMTVTGRTAQTPRSKAK